MKKFWVFLSVFLFISSIAFAAPTAEEIVSKIHENQNKINSMSAKIVTTIKSDKNSKAIEQKGIMKTKGHGKVLIEMEKPVKQVTIINGDKMFVENKSTGQKFVQDLSKIRQQTGQKNVGGDPFDQTKILDNFNLSLEEKGFFKKSYIITGIPKDKSSLFSKIKFYVDASRSVPTKLEIYDANDKLVTQADVEYKNIKNIWVLSKNTSWVEVPGGKMEVTMKLEDVKINESISDSEFEIKE
ncbi:hypothetical protein A3J90_04590 [candidate division WOR-1 bacterium RIFOXYC2_FULL_37_10]|uniref:Uncharacterized protein TP-0789 domain-containing protein n=1 Tax=candidate division WOR-1 bacterium RIFOXYB2_FULL_37_13 TaxID=1802579 RepID=A0A1F4SLU6_UNCSA|nr:MAG: hypothetical protein A2310_01290 [candidate division WOR-1 bacterium RIFOXYB2_FULL_37_13]OGC33449.1 MAG: hypothetical protein A3J90_04590 [candidate division WOR-1 bacterium RIFOXYC2_FULL_37_10]